MILLSGGSPSLSFPALAVEYGYGATIWTLPGGSATFSVYLDGELIQQYSHPISCKCRLYLPHWVTLFDNFDLIAGSNIISHSESNSLQLLGKITNLCSPTVWHPELQTTLTITSGSELGEFVDQNGQSLGSIVTRKGSELGSIRFAANGEQPPEAQGTVTIEATSRGITTTVSFTVLRTAPLVDHFEIRLEPEEIAFTEASRIFVQAKDANNQDIEFDENEKLLFYLKSNPEYGTFIDAKGDTIKTSPPSLPDVSYRDARDGKVRFAAVKTNPKTQATSVIRVEWQQDPTKMGEKEITVLEKTLKIVMDGERTVQPVIPPATNARPSVENRKPFAVRWTRGGILQGDQPFRLTTDYVDGSGGHDHITPRRPNANENYGRFISTMDGATGRPFQGRTRSDQMVPFDYVASQFGGQMVLRVQATENALLWDTVSVVERVPGLVPLQSGTNNLITFTSTEAFHRLNNSNHSTETTRSAVHRALAQYAQEYGMPEDIFLAVIDMSLPFGGGFDIRGGWEQDISGQRGAAGHQFHRQGKSVDFSRYYRDGTGRVITVNIFINDELRETTREIDEDELDRRFDLHGFDRWERRIRKIHYESRN